MENPKDVLAAKEHSLARVRREVNALRVAIPLLRDENDPDDLDTNELADLPSEWSAEFMEVPNESDSAGKIQRAVRP